MQFDYRKSNATANQLGSTQNLFMDSFLGKTIAITIFLLCIYLMTLVIDHNLVKDFDYYIGLLTSISFIYFLLKVVISFFYKSVKKDPLSDHKVSVVLPSFNEGTESVKKSIECLVNQDYPVHEIIFIDDGSDSIEAYETAVKMSEEFKAINEKKPDSHLPKITAHRFTKNQGKRAAQTWAFKRAEGDILMLSDSDGYIYPDAVRELLKPFRDKKVTSVVGHINPRNSKDSLITRLQDILYTSAFRIGRGAQSVTNSVLVCSGALSMHRKNFILNNLDRFAEGTAMGIKMDAGDDRCLTMLSLENGGKTKYQSTALCITDVPEKTGKFFKQQVRWNKSFYLYTLETLKFAWKRPNVLFWVLAEGFVWLIFGISSLVSLLTGSTTALYLLLIYSMAYLTLSSLAGGIYYVFRNPLVYLLSPFFALMHMLILFPVRVFSLLTIKADNWGTR
ncbi:hyaluronan synthase HasA [Salinibacillus aidingensis]|uniref:Hyaluronan synthase n=1 Tax=Salinibacillus aidingensis TaxID=237684 RepID=A0ABN1B0S6_9BACI